MLGTAHQGQAAVNIPTGCSFESLLFLWMLEAASLLLLACIKFWHASDCWLKTSSLQSCRHGLGVTALLLRMDTCQLRT